MYNIKKKMQDSNRKLLESFYSAPGEDKVEIKLDGAVVGYNSKELNDELIRVINGNSSFSSSAKAKFSKAIQKRELFPIYSSESWMGDVFDSFTQIFRALSGMMIGFYDGKRIILMVANLRNLMGDISEKEIFEIVTHEYQHKFAGERSGYHQDSSVKKVLKEWYTAFIDDYFNEPISDKHRKMLMDFWLNIKAENMNKIAKVINDRLVKFEKLVNQIYGEDKAIGSELIDLGRYTNAGYFGGMHANIRPLESGYVAYKKLGIEPTTFVFQEFIIASEVVCVCAASNKTLGNQLLSKFG